MLLVEDTVRGQKRGPPDSRPPGPHPHLRGDTPLERGRVSCKNTSQCLVVSFQVGTRAVVRTQKDLSLCDKEHLGKRVGGQGDRKRMPGKGQVGLFLCLTPSKHEHASPQDTLNCHPPSIHSWVHLSFHSSIHPSIHLFIQHLVYIVSGARPRS